MKSRWGVYVGICISLATNAGSLAQELQADRADAGTEVTRQEIALQAGKGARSYFLKSGAPQSSDLRVGQELSCLAYFFTLNEVVRQFRTVKFSTLAYEAGQLQISGLRGIDRLVRRNDSFVGDGPAIEGCSDCSARQYSVYVRVAKDKKIVMEILQPAGLTLMVRTPTTDIIDSPVTRGTEYSKVAGYIVCAAPEAPEATDAGVGDAGL